MGNEYRLRVAIPSKEEGNRILRTAPFFAGFEQSYGCAEYRNELTKTGMPNVSASIEEYGFYFNAHGGFDPVTQSVLGYLVLSCASFGVVEFSDLE
jgi:hypothetical protein